MSSTRDRAAFVRILGKALSISETKGKPQVMIRHISPIVLPSLMIIFLPVKAANQNALGKKISKLPSPAPSLPSEPTKRNFLSLL
jgi:hypothetical protein